MKIIRESIRELDNEGTAFYELSCNLSCSYGVVMTIRVFTYESNGGGADSFSIRDLKEIFYDWKDGEPYCKKKVKGVIEVGYYLESRELMNINFSDENSQLTHAETVPYIEKFWDEVAKVFTLPPTHVYIHEPDSDSIFDCGVYWQFCHIYLNDKTKQGIVLSAYAFS